jgi:dTDP-D-glucose 4,6-dehydratase
MGKELKVKMQDFHKDNPGHDIHYGLQNNNLDWKPRDVKECLKEVIDWQTNHREWL